MSVGFSETLFNQMPVVGIMRNIPQEVVRKIVPLYVKAGFTNLEVTINSPGAEGLIGELSRDYPELNIGAGTVCNSDDLERALKAGASFIVTPILDLEVMKQCREQGIPIMPGAFTPLEIYTAWKEGATMVKIFPATQLGPTYVKDVLAPLSQIRVLPTGGVTVENIGDFFEAGASGVGMGSSLFEKKLTESGDFEGLYRHFKAVAKKVTNFQERSR